MRKQIKYSLILILTPFWVLAQNPNGNYNPYVNSGTITPSPIWPVEANGKGTVQFNIGNSGSDALQVFSDQHITLTLTLSYGAPDNADPVMAVGGTAAELFSWTFNNNTYSAKQTSSIPAGYSGTIEIAYKVIKNSNSPGLNGFNVNISPAAYQTESNSQDDDAVSSYTYTEIRDYSDAPAVYGVAWHLIDFKNYLGSLVDGEIDPQISDNADGDDLDAASDEDGVVFPGTMQQGETVALSISVTGMGYLSGWIDWNADGDFNDGGEHILQNVGRFAGTQDHQVTIPVDAAVNNPIFARFRFAHETVNGSIDGGDDGEVEDYMIFVSPSPSAPGIPADLEVIQSTQEEVTLSWSASTDDVSVEGYRIYRDDIELASVNDLSYVDNTVELGNIYAYSISAFDGDGFESGRSSKMSVEIMDITAPTVPGDLSIQVVSSEQIRLAWYTSSDNLGVEGYHIYRNNVLLTSTNDTVYEDITVIQGNAYEYAVSSYDAAGNESERTLPVSFSSVDDLPPSIPSGLMLLSIGESGASLAWHQATDNVGVINYNLYRDGDLQNTVSDTTIKDSEVISGQTYTYRVSALDAAGNESPKSDPLTITLASTDYVIACQLSIHPNPSRGEFYLGLEGARGDFMLEIISPIGNIVLQKIIQVEEQFPEIVINLPDFPPGLYNIRVFREDSIYFGKLMIIY